MQQQSDYLSHKMREGGDVLPMTLHWLWRKMWMGSFGLPPAPLPSTHSLYLVPAAQFSMVRIPPDEMNLSSVLAMQSCQTRRDTYTPSISPPSPGPSVCKLMLDINTNKDPGSDKAKAALLTSSRHRQSAWLLLTPDTSLLSGPGGSYMENNPDLSWETQQLSRVFGATMELWVIPAGSVAGWSQKKGKVQILLQGGHLQ